jgi:hypothetical protein
MHVYACMHCTCTKYIGSEDEVNPKVLTLGKMW